VTHEPTEQTTHTTLADQRSDAQRRSYMAALSLTEQIMSTAKVLPYSFTIRVAGHSPTAAKVQFYFHCAPEAVSAFADEYRLDMSIEIRESGSVYTEASGSLRGGVRLVAWALMSAEQADALTGGVR
jgi:hypothetical protein